MWYTELDLTWPLLRFALKESHINCDAILTRFCSTEGKSSTTTWIIYAIAFAGRDVSMYTYHRDGHMLYEIFCVSNVWLNYWGDDNGDHCYLYKYRFILWYHYYYRYFYHYRLRVVIDVHIQIHDINVLWRIWINYGGTVNRLNYTTVKEWKMTRGAIYLQPNIRRRTLCIGWQICQFCFSSNFHE